MLFVGLENAVHFVTDNASNMRYAGKRFEEDFPSLYWSPCVAHCINLMVADMGKLEVVEICVKLASRISVGDTSSSTSSLCHKLCCITEYLQA